MALGTLTLHRFNGDEAFSVSEATILYFCDEQGATVQFEVKTEAEPVKTLPDTRDLRGHAHGIWQFSLPSFNPGEIVGKIFSIPQGYDETSEEYLALFYYVDHQPIDSNEIRILGRDGDLFRVQITGQVPDINYYDGSKPPTTVVIDASFTLSQSEEALEPVG